MTVTFEYGTDRKALTKAILYVLSLPPRDVPTPAVEATEPEPVNDLSPSQPEPAVSVPEHGEGTVRTGGGLLAHQHTGDGAALETRA